jgi:hypothetical protein
MQKEIVAGAARGRWLALLAGVALLASCESSPNGSGAEPGGADPDVGSFSMQLKVGGSFHFSQVNYTVSRSGFQKTGSVDVSGSSTVATVIGGIPLGTGYALQLTAQDTDHKLMPCAGSATFSLTSAATVAVPVDLVCHEVPKTTTAIVPVPRWATIALAGLLLAFGIFGWRRRDRAAR